MSTHTAGRFEINKYDEIKGKHNSFKVTEYHRNGSGKTEAEISLSRDELLDLNYLVTRALGVVK